MSVDPGIRGRVRVRVRTRYVDIRVGVRVRVRVTGVRECIGVCVLRESAMISVLGASMIKSVL